MCTVTVFQDTDDLRVTMNRDETRLRGAEISPALQQRIGAPDWIGPRDSDKGGTWMGVNTHGVVACLLNRYAACDEAHLPDEPESRGAIIPRTLQNTTVTQCRAWLESDVFTPTIYPPFTLLVVDPQNGIQMDWTGSGALIASELTRPWHMTTSSFFDSEVVVPWRQAAFFTWLDRGARDTHGVPEFHVYHPENAANKAPLMSRDISCTRSITQIAVTPSADHIILRHAPVVEKDIDWQQFDVAHRLKKRVHAHG